jgi:hypothetical protein
MTRAKMREWLQDEWQGMDSADRENAPAEFRELLAAYRVDTRAKRPARRPAARCDDAGVLPWAVDRAIERAPLACADRTVLRLVLQGASLRSAAARLGVNHPFSVLSKANRVLARLRAFDPEAWGVGTVAEALEHLRRAALRERYDRQRPETTTAEGVRLRADPVAV